MTARKMRDIRTALRGAELVPYRLGTIGVVGSNLDFLDTESISFLRCIFGQICIINQIITKYKLGNEEGPRTPPRKVRSLLSFGCWEQP